MATLQLSPDLGFIDVSDHFDSSKNPLLIEIAIADLTPVAGDDPTPGTKGVGQFFLTVDGQTYEIPLDTRRRLRVKRGGRVRWQSTTGDSGTFRYFPQAPPVFDAEELVR